MTPTDFLKSVARVSSKAIFPYATTAIDAVSRAKNAFTQPARPPAQAPQQQVAQAVQQPVQQPVQQKVAAPAPKAQPVAQPARPPVQTSSAPMATLVGPNGQKVAVQSGSQQAQQYFSQGYTLPGAPARPPVQQPTAPAPATVAPAPQEAPKSEPTVSIASAPDPSDQVRALQEAYLKSLEISPEEEAVQKRLNAISEAQANLDQSYRLGDEAVRTQAIPMQFITGQQAALQRQLTNQQTGLAAQATPLKDQIALLQARRAAAGNVAEKRISFENERLKTEREQNKPIEVGGSLLQYDPVTKTYKAVYSAPEKPQNPITLSEGQVLIDPKTGERIAAGNPKSQAESSQPMSYREWQLAGSPGTFADWIDRNNAGSGNKPLSGEASKVLTIAQTMVPEIERLKQAFANDYRGALQGILTGTNRELVKLVDNVADKVGRLRSGGAINRDEEARFKRQIGSLGDLAFGNSTEAIQALDGLLQEAQSVANGIRPGSTSSNQSESVEAFAQRAGFPVAEIQGLRNRGRTDEQIRDLIQRGSGLTSAATVQALNGSDARVEKLARAIAQHETGNRNIPGATGELPTRYQFMPDTWRRLAQKYLGNAKAPTTDANQDTVAKAYIQDLFRQGYNEQQIAMIWNGGTPNRKVGTTKTKDGRTIQYDTGRYANNVLNIYKKLT